MQVKINDQIHQLTDSCPRSLAGILLSFVPDLKPKGIAVALNNQVVSRSQWAETLVTDGSHILIITATQGG